jgi:integrase
LGVFARPDSPFFWLLLERPGQKPIREATEIPKQGGSPEQHKELRRQAQEIYAKRMVDLSRRRHHLPTSLEARTFAAYRAWYTEHVSAHKRGSVRERSMLKQLGAFFDSYELSAIDQALAREWRTARLKDVAAATVRREEAILKHMLTTAVPKYLEANPLHGFRRIRVPDTDTRVLTQQEETRLLKALRTQEDRALITGALDTLLRLSNIASLLRAQDHGTYLFSDTKVGAVKIPISSRFRKALDGIRRRGPADVHYFPTYANPASRNNRVILMFMDACKRAKVATGRKTGGISFHCLRHTGASRMLDGGFDVKTVMEIGGWKNLAVMQRYLHPSEARKREAVNAIGRRRSVR